MDRFILLSGCSGGGKSTLLDELGRRDFPIVAEPGRRIVAEEMACGGGALPWRDMAAFARRAMTMALEDRAAATKLTSGWVFFDRGLIDAAAALEHETGEPVLEPLRSGYRYHRRVFMTPPWPEIYVADDDRCHDLSDAIAEYERLRGVYASLDYQVDILRKTSVRERADDVIAAVERD